MRNVADFTIVVALATSSQNLQGGEDDWYKNSGIVDGNVQGLGQDWGLTMNAEGKIAAGLGGGFVKPKTTIYSAAGLNDGQFHVVTMTRQQADLALYVDNSLSASSATADTANRSPLGMAIGMTFTDSSRIGFDGDIAEVRIYNGQLTATELATVHGELDRYYNNTVPVAVADTYTFPEDAGALDVFVPANRGVLVNDLDAEGDALSAQLVQGTQHGQLSLNANGSFVYDSDPDFFGTDSFTYTRQRLSCFGAGHGDDPRHAAVRSGRRQRRSVQAAVGQRPERRRRQRSVDQRLESGPGQPAGRSRRRPVTAGLLNLQPDGSFTYDPQGFAGRAHVWLPHQRWHRRIEHGDRDADCQHASAGHATTPTAQRRHATDHDARHGPRWPMTSMRKETRLTATLISDPSHGVLTLAADGSFNYVPDADYFGSDEFTYQLSDGEDISNTATVRLTIQPVNDAPAAVADTYFTLANTPLTIAAAEGVLRNDTDTEAQALTARLAQDVSQGSLTLNADGSFAYVPPADFTGVATFSYRADDGQDQSPPTTRADRHQFAGATAADRDQRGARRSGHQDGVGRVHRAAQSRHGAHRPDGLEARAMPWITCSRRARSLAPGASWW